jgi:hypothetical protein
VLLLLAVPLTLAITLQEYAGASRLAPIVNAIYPILQPVSRALLGLWLWREAAAGMPVRP